MNESHNGLSFSSDEQLEELLALYAFGGLEAAEIEMVEQHLASHPEAEAILAAYLEATAVLPYAVEPLQPAATNTAALFARVAEDAELRFGTAAAPAAAHTSPNAEPATPQVSVPRKTVQPSGSSTPSIWEKVTRFFQTPAFTGLSLAAAAAALIWSISVTGQLQERNSQINSLNSQNSTLLTQQDELETQVANLQVENERIGGELTQASSENGALLQANASLETTNRLLSEDIATITADKDDLQVALFEANAANDLLAEQAALSAQLEEQSGILALFNSPATQAYSIPGTVEQPQAEGQIIVDPANNHAILIVNGMEPLAEGLVYQVLLIRGSEHDTAETFRVDTQGQMILLVSSDKPLETFDAIGVSVEPEGGSPQRTGEVILLGGIVN